MVDSVHHEFHSVPILGVLWPLCSEVEGKGVDGGVVCLTLMPATKLETTQIHARAMQYDMSSLDYVVAFSSHITLVSTMLSQPIAMMAKISPKID